MHAIEYTHIHLFVTHFVVQIEINPGPDGMISFVCGQNRFERKSENVSRQMTYILLATRTLASL